MHEGLDDVARALVVRVAVDPDPGKRSLDGELPGEARGVRVQDARGDPPRGEQIDEDLRLGEMGGCAQPLQNFIDSSTLTPSSFMPWRLDTL